LTGTVTAIFPERGYEFVEAEDREWFLHRGVYGFAFYSLTTDTGINFEGDPDHPRGPRITKILP
jgi:hypothetical protein